MITVLQASTLIFSIGLMVVFSKNPIHSVLYLILTFLLTTLLFLSLNVEFLALLFIVIYVGAIAVLFLFVVMMLNIKITELNKRLTVYLPISIMIMFTLFSQMYLANMKGSVPFHLKDNDFELINYILNRLAWIPELNAVTLFDYSDSIDKLDDIVQIGFVMYTSYSFVLLLAAMILLLAMISAITLTAAALLPNKSQDYFMQSNSTINTAIYFAK